MPRPRHRLRSHETYPPPGRPRPAPDPPPTARPTRRPPARDLGPLLRGLLAGALTLLAAAVLTAGLASVERAPASAAEPARPAGHALRLDGRSALRVEGTAPLLAGDGVFTLECRVRGPRPFGTQSVAGNRHYGGFGLTWSHAELSPDRPSGWVGVSHVPGTQHSGYLLLRPVQPWRTERWTHLALAFDGRLARLFVDGAPVAEAVTPGRPRASAQPLLIGADPDEHGAPTAWFTGEIDDLRVSRVVRYERAFVPPRELATDPGTTLLLDFEDPAHPFADRSPLRQELTTFGAPQRVPVR